MSLRLKFVLVLFAGVVLTALMLGAVVRYTSSNTDEALLREQAQWKLEQARSVYSETGKLVLDARINSEDVPEAARESAQQGRTATVHGTLPRTGEPVMWAATPITVGGETAVLSVYHSAVEYERMRKQSSTTIVVASVVGALLLGGFGALTVGTISGRLTRGAEVARQIAAGDTSVKIGDVITSGHDEVADFADAVDSALAQLSERIDTEQRFTADLAHELRTPLTGLITAAGLLEEDSRPAELVKERAQRLQELVEDLLEVSRLEGGAAHVAVQPMHVATTLHALISNLRSSGAVGDHVINSDFALADVTINTDQRRFERIVTNLVINSIKHGADPITVTATDTAVRVEDHGPGYPTDILTIGPTRFSSGGGGGMGLGLVIAQGQAKLLGMDLVFGTGQAGGAKTDLKWGKDALAG